MSQHEQLIENYEDALFKLLMEAVIEYEGKQIQEEIERLNSDPSFSVPPELDRRCIRTINKIARRKRMSRTGKKIYKIFSKFSVAAVIALALFTSAYAAFPEVRVSTLNLLIEVSDIATELTFGDADGANNEANSAEMPSVSVPDGAMTIAGYVLPESIADNYELVDEGSDQFAAWASLGNDSNSLIYIEIQNGEGNSVNINTENAIASEIINEGRFQSVVSQQENGIIIAGIADIKRTNFIYITFEGINFESAVSTITDFLEENMEGTE